MVKCLTHGLRGFNGAVLRRLATLTVTMLISSCWQLSSEVELRRIFDVYKPWANSGSHEFVMEICFDTWGHTGDSLTACVKMQHSPSTSACRPRPRVSCIFTLVVRPFGPFWPLVSKYTISIQEAKTGSWRTASVKIQHEQWAKRPCGLIYWTIFFFTNTCETQVGSPFTNIENAPQLNFT